LATLIFLSGINSSFSADKKALEILDKASLVEQLATLAPKIVSGAVEIGARRKMCNYFYHVFENGMDVEEKVNRRNSTKDFIPYKQCCTTMGLEQLLSLSEALGNLDPLPTLPDLRRRQIKQTEMILHSLTQDQHYAALMKGISDQIKEASKEIDRVACAPLSATYQAMMANAEPLDR